MKPKVYIIMDSHGKNLLPAKEHGDLHVILKGDEPNNIAAAKLARALSEMTSRDYLLLIGNPVYIALAAHIAMSMLHGTVNLLIWDRETYSYCKETINYEPIAR